MTTIAQEDVFTAVISMLRAQQAFPVGDGEPPDDEVPYYIVYPIEGGGYFGPPLTNPEADAAVVLQVNSVGRRRDQAQRLGTIARNLVLGRQASGAFQNAITGSTFVVAHRRPDGGPAGTDYSGRPPDRLFTARERYVLHVTPTSG